ncbi:MAG: acriflavin resistance protein [Rhodospirillaceae bacterium]|nr:acriflavin resistance protein [Rhodospirillaceae bacterium]
MNVAGFTVRRPIFTVMMTLIAVTLGMIALHRLPIDLMPDVTYPTLSVQTSYENASPEEMEQLVTRLVEESVAAVPGVEEISSSSSEGSSSVRVSFAWGTDLDVATNDIRDRLERILDNLPEEAERPQIRKFDVNAFPILIIGVASQMDPIELRALVDDQMSYRLERIPGVAAVDIWGGMEREIHVDVYDQKIKALGLPLTQVRDAIRSANVTVPAGEIESGQYDISLMAPGEFTDLDQLRNTVVAVRNGAPIYLHQIADVIDTHEKITRHIRINGEPGIRLAIRKQSGTNTVQVAQAVHAEIDQLRKDFPQITFVPVIDTSTYIERSIDNVTQSILYGGSLAVFVLLFFLRNVRTTAVIAVAIPISVVTTFALIYFGGFTLNLMTLGGLALGVGMMVDNAIVVLENIARVRQEDRAEAREAAIGGTRQVAAAIVGSTATTLVIFLPMVFAEEVTGVMFRQLAYVVSFSLLCSLVVALTLVPMLASRLVQDPGTSGFARTRVGGHFLRVSERGFQAVENAYGRLLSAALGHRFLTLAIIGLVFVASLALVSRIGSEFMPSADESEVRVDIEMEAGTRLPIVDDVLKQAEAIVAKSIPEMVSYVARTDGGGRRAPASGEINIALVSPKERSRSSEEIAADLRGKLTDIPGTVIRTRAGQGLFLLRLNSSSQENLQLDIRGYDLKTLDQLADTVTAAIRDVPGITDARKSRQSGVQQHELRINRDRASDLGLSVEQVARTIEAAVAGTSAGNFRQGGQESRILVGIKDSERFSLDDVLDLTVTTDDGRQIALRNVVQLVRDRGPLEIQRRDQQRVISVYANIAGRELSRVVDDVRGELQSIPVPRNYDIVFSGDYDEQQSAFGELFLNFVLALALVYMVLACLYESLVDPLIVMMSLPLALIGVVAALLLTNTTFNVQSFIGCIMLIGIVVNNAILIVDQATQLVRNERMAVVTAVREAGRRRLRPILMTSLTTILALVPLALGIGEGSEAQAPMARVVIGGLLSASVITLVLIPTVYALIHRDRRTVEVVETKAAAE